MNKYATFCYKCLLPSALVQMLVTPLALAENSSIAEALSNSETNLSFRARYETVDHFAFEKDAKALTLKSRLTFKSGELNGWQLVTEFDDVHQVGIDDYNSGQGTSPDKSDYPIIADPEGSEVNQAFLAYSSGDNTFKLGRQRILLNNQRFVGGVGFRQNEQTYDGFSYQNKNVAGNDIDVTYAYIYNVNRIFGDKVSAGDHSHNTHLLNVKGKFSDDIDWAAYAFNIDNEDAVATSNSTYGIRLNGKYKTDSLKGHYTVEYANQSDNADNPTDYSAQYLLLETGLGTDDIKVSLGLESLGADDNGQGFQTPLATLHAFNGWADMFLGTPTGGLEDRYIKINGKFAGLKWLVKFHNFDVENGSGDLGDEFDFVINKKIDDNYSASLKYASYSGDNATDVDKLWLTFSATF